MAGNSEEGQGPQRAVAPMMMMMMMMMMNSLILSSFLYILFSFASNNIYFILFIFLLFILLSSDVVHPNASHSTVLTVTKSAVHFGKNTFVSDSKNLLPTFEIKSEINALLDLLKFVI
jgi:hypothetical protein